MDNIKQVVKDIRFLIATDCCDETIQARIENFINDTQSQALRIHDVSGRSEQLKAFMHFAKFAKQEYGFHIPLNLMKEYVKSL